MPPAKGTRAERRAMRDQLVAAGVLSPAGGPARDEDSLELAVDMITRALPPERRPVPAEELADVQARLVAMKGQLASESQRARVAEAAFDRALQDANLSRAERDRLELELGVAKSSRERLEQQVSTLVDHERSLLQFHGTTRELEARLESLASEMRSRIGDLEGANERRTAGERHHAERRQRRRRRVRVVLALLCWAVGAAAIAAGTFSGLVSAPWVWSGFAIGTLLALAAGALLLVGRRRGAEVATWVFLAVELVLFVARGIAGS